MAKGRPKEEKYIINLRRLKKAVKENRPEFLRTDKSGRQLINHDKFKKEIDKYFRDTSGDSHSKGVSNSCMGNMFARREITGRSVESVAEFVRVDPAYLTGDQLRPTKKETEEEIKRRADIKLQLKIRQAARFASAYDWRIVTTEGSGTFSVYDPEGDLICEGRDEKDLYPFLEAVEHLTQLGEDITYQFLGSLYTNKSC